MGVKRKQHSAEFKARVAMAALSGEKTLAELSAEFGVHPTMISNWKQELVKRAGELFARGSKAPAAEDAQKVIDDLHRKIGSAARFVQNCTLSGISASSHGSDVSAPKWRRALSATRPPPAYDATPRRIP